MFQGLLLAIVIMIDGSEKRNSDKLAFKLLSSRLMNGFKVRALMGTKPTTDASSHLNFSMH